MVAAAMYSTGASTMICEKPVGRFEFSSDLSVVHLDPEKEAVKGRDIAERK